MSKHPDHAISRGRQRELPKSDYWHRQNKSQRPGRVSQGNSTVHRCPLVMTEQHNRSRREAVTAQPGPRLLPGITAVPRGARLLYRPTARRALNGIATRLIDPASICRPCLCSFPLNESGVGVACNSAVKIAAISLCAAAADIDGETCRAAVVAYKHWIRNRKIRLTIVLLLTQLVRSIADEPRHFILGQNTTARVRRPACGAHYRDACRANDQTY